MEGPPPSVCQASIADAGTAGCVGANFCLFVVDHVLVEPGTTLASAFDEWKEMVDQKACCDVSLHLDIGRWHEGLKEELETMVKDKGNKRAR